MPLLVAAGKLIFVTECRDRKLEVFILESWEFSSNNSTTLFLLSNKEMVEFKNGNCNTKKRAWGSRTQRLGMMSFRLEKQITRTYLRIFIKILKWK